MYRLLALAALMALASSDLSAQVLDDRLVPPGLARIEVSPVFTSWDSRFGREGPTTREQRLGEDLTTTAAHTLLPGTEALRAAVEAMTGTVGYAPIFGETSARVTADVTRVELGAHVGVLDWLTVGVTVPITRTRTNVDVWFRPDTITGDLGVNPTVTAAQGVSSFLEALAAAGTAAQTRAAQVCSSSPGSPGCASAQSLAARASDFHASAGSAYGASMLFPVATSGTATALSQSVATLSADLVSAGLPGIGPAMPFATQWVAEPEFWTLPTSPRLGYSGPLGSVNAPWYAGDTEITATVRLLGGGADPAVSPPSVEMDLVATALVRLPTGAIDDPDVLLDVGSGDGQTDFEGRLLARLAAGPLGLHVGGRYGAQRARTLVRRVAPPEMLLAPADTRRTVEWEPGAYFGVEIAPVWRFTQELDLVAEYRGFRKYRDRYRLADSAGGSSLDLDVLEQESGVTLHEVGGSLRYDTLGRLSSGVRPLQAHLRIVHAIAGGGGRTPITTQIELGVRLFRRLWRS